MPGSAAPRTAHFTSPIRRYADLIAHRALLSLLGAGEIEPERAEVREAGSWCSERERESMVIERDADKVCAAFLLERELFESGWAREFEGEISGVIGAGAFVRFGGDLGDVYEGFMPARRMRGDRYDLNATETALVGRRSGREVRLGDPATAEGRRSRGCAGPRRPGAGRSGGAMSKRGKRKVAAGDVATNRRASHKYELVERFEAGIELQGSEVKSLREGKTQIGDAYAAIEGGEVWLRNAHIPPYGPASTENHDPERPRKLLLHRYEIERLIGRLQRKGLTMIPTRIYFKGAAREGRARARPRQGGSRPPPRDPRPRRAAGGRARGPPPVALARRSVALLAQGLMRARPRCTRARAA